MTVYEKVGFDDVKNAYIISEREDGRLLCIYTAYPDFTHGTFNCYPRSVYGGLRFQRSGKKTIKMEEVSNGKH